MREFTTLAKDIFTKGLRPRKRFGTENRPMLTECTRLKPTESGLREVETITYPFEADFVTHPFAQLFKARNMTLLADSTDIYSVDSSWNPSAITLYDYLTEEIVGSIISDGVWHIADAGKFVMLFNGSSIIYISGEETMFEETAKFHIIRDRTVNTGCYHRGRIIMGGFSASDFWGDQWQSILEGLSSDLHISIANALKMDSNFISWSAIGGGNVLDIFYPDRAINGLLAEFKEGNKDPLFLDYWRRNDCGFAPTMYPGTVLIVKPFYDRVIAYGDNGFTVFKPMTADSPTLSIISNDGVGVLSRSAIAGNDKFHVFIDGSDVLWRYSEKGLERLGYEEYIKDLGSNIVLTLDDHENDVYISDGETTLVLTANGLGKSPNHPTSLIRSDNTLYGLFSSDISEESIIVSDWFDFRSGDLKTITTISLGFTINSDEDTKVYIALDTGYDTDNTDFTRSDWVIVNKQGWARLQKTAKRFRLAIKVTDNTDFRLDYATIKWQRSTLQTVRGLHVDTIDF